MDQPDLGGLPKKVRIISRRSISTREIIGTLDVFLKTNLVAPEAIQQLDLLRNSLSRVNKEEKSSAADHLDISSRKRSELAKNKKKKQA